MSLRTWLWLGTALNAIIFLPAAVMAYVTIDFAVANSESGAAGFVAFLFLALPVFCVLASYSAWRIHSKRPDDGNAAFLMAAPLLYAAFIVVFLLWD
jgi:hypothetical protein